jgi:hypothetical protein
MTANEARLHALILEMGWRMLAMSEALSNCAERRECRHKGDAMAEDVRAAEERWRAQRYYDGPDRVDKDEYYVAVQKFDDMETLTAAYLALAAEVRAVLAEVDADRNICDGETHKLFDRLRAAVGQP